MIKSASDLLKRNILKWYSDFRKPQLKKPSTPILLSSPGDYQPLQALLITLSHYITYHFSVTLIHIPLVWKKDNLQTDPLLRCKDASKTKYTTMWLCTPTWIGLKLTYVTHYLQLINLVECREVEQSEMEQNEAGGASE